MNKVLKAADTTSTPACQDLPVTPCSGCKCRPWRGHGPVSCTAFGTGAGTGSCTHLPTGPCATPAHATRASDISAGHEGRSNPPATQDQRMQLVLHESFCGPAGDGVIHDGRCWPCPVH